MVVADGVNKHFVSCAGAPELSCSNNFGNVLGKYATGDNSPSGLNIASFAHPCAKIADFVVKL